MTRINVVPVTELCDQHLLAEHRELTRIPNGVLSGKLKVHYDDRPSEYTLGAGHVKFFTNKIGWLFRRYLALHLECKKRGFNVVDKFPTLDLFEDNSLGEFETTPDNLRINRTRIIQQWPTDARYYGKPYV